MSTRARVLIAAGVVIAIAVGGGLWWFLRDDAPDEVSLEAAVDQVTDVTDTDMTEAEAEATGIEGTWTIDSETGEFDFETATATFAGFRVDEELSSIGANTAVGRTGEVSGSFTVDGGIVTEGGFEVDLTTLTTNQSLRDGRVQDALETSSFPTATFTLNEPIELPDGAAGGDPVSVTASGDLTVHGVTRTVDIALDAQLVNGTVVVVGSLDFALDDFDVEAPTAPAVVSVSDDAVLEFQLLLTAA